MIYLDISSEFTHWMKERAKNNALMRTQLDEPTNHLDLEAIDALAEAIKVYNGGVVLVSHDFRLIDQVARDIWVCENKTVRRWDKDIREYKKHLSKKAEREAKERKLAKK